MEKKGRNRAREKKYDDLEFPPASVRLLVGLGARFSFFTDQNSNIVVSPLFFGKENRDTLTKYKIVLRNSKPGLGKLCKYYNK